MSVEYKPEVVSLMIFFEQNIGPRLRECAGCKLSGS